MSMFSASSSSPTFGSINLLGSTSRVEQTRNDPSVIGTAEFGATSTASLHPPAFGGTSAFCATNGATSGQTLSTFGKNHEDSSNIFGYPRAPAFGVANNSHFGMSSTPAFSSFSFGQPAVSLSEPRRKGTTTMLESSGFGKSEFNINQKGSTIAKYSATPEKDSPRLKVESICCMKAYKDKSQDELRFEDYQLGDNGQRCSSPFGVIDNSRCFVFNKNSSTAASTPFPKSQQPTNSNIFPTKTSFISSPCTSTRSVVAQPFGPLKPASTSSTTSIFSPSKNPWALSTSSSSTLIQSPLSTSPLKNPFALSTPSSSTLNQSPLSTSPLKNPFNLSTSSSSTLAQSPLSTFPLNNPFDLSTSSSSTLTQSPLYTPPLKNPFDLSTSSSSTLSQSPLSTFLLNNPFALSTSSSSMFTQSPLSTSQYSISPSGHTMLTKPSSSLLTTPGSTQITASLGPMQPGMTPNVGPTFQTTISSHISTGITSSSGIGQGVGHLSLNSHMSYSPSITGLQPSQVMFPSDKQHAVQVPFKQLDSAISVQYGISSLPVTDKPAPVRQTSSLIIRHSSLLNRNRLPPQKYNPTSDKPKVPFFMDKENGSGILRKEAVVIPRINPRDWVCSTTKEFPSRSDSSRLSELKHTSMDGMLNGHEVGDKPKLASEEMHNDNTGQLEHYSQDSLDAIMPKLQRSDYYTVPSIQELMSKEKEEAGFCCHVKDFIVGRHGHGSIKFLEETDIRKIDLDSAVHFNYREVIVYMDENKKPPVGQGLNKPAEITLLNVRCINKSTGKEYRNGPVVDKYRNMLIKKAVEQGAEFVSYDPVEGEWKFKIPHF